MKPGASPRLFKDGFLKGLEDVIELITSEGATAAAGYDTTVEPLLLSEMKQTEGRADAFDFALRSRASITELQARIRETEELLSTLPAERTEAPRAAKPRLFYDSYLQGLTDAVRIISEGKA